MEAINIYAVAINWKPNKEGLIPIAIRFDYNRQRVGHEQLQHRIKPTDWIADKRQVRSSCSSGELINQLIENRLNVHRNYFLRREVLGLSLTRLLVKQYIHAGKSVENYSAFAEHMILTKVMKDGKGYSEDSQRRYRDEIARMIKFRDPVCFHHITPAFLLSYKQWMQNIYKKKDGQPLDRNSIWKALSFVRTVYNYAIDQKLILPQSSPFSEFQVGSFEPDEDQIKWLELPQIIDLEKVLTDHQATLPHLTYSIGWRFLSMCVLGMRISDAMHLDDYSFNDAGDLQFTPYKTRRNGNRAQIPITADRQRRYVAKTLENKIPFTNHKSFRTTFNAHLKILGAMADIRINLTSHVGRHTMGSFLVDGNVETKAAMAILGIKSEGVLNIYRHLKQGKLRSEADKLGGVM